MIDPKYFGLSFSSKQCRSFKLDEQATLGFLLKKVGFRRFRLMSYWNEHEKTPGNYDFTALDQQIALIKKSSGSVTLCLGARQPRWPESHWPKWALDLPQAERYEALYRFIENVVDRYKNNPTIISWQLENEALNRSFGRNGDFNRTRLRHEYQLVKQRDPSRPVIMSTSNTWGIPIRRPRPDIFGFTLYQTQFENGTYSHSKLPLWWWPLRARIIRLVPGRPCFIHELQAEPWGPKAIWEMPVDEQSKSMGVEQIKTNMRLAKQTKLYPIDLWGGEWWYWRHLQGDETIWQTVQRELAHSSVK